MNQFIIKAVKFMAILTVVFAVNFIIATWLTRFVGSTHDPTSLSFQLMIVQLAIANYQK